MTGVFTDTGGSSAAPTTVKFVLTTPDGTDTVATRAGSTSTGSSNSINQVSSGTYTYDHTASASGPYWYRFSSTGNITSADEDVFRVRRLHTST